MPAPARAAYTINAVMDYNVKTVAVDQTIVYPNHSGLPSPTWSWLWFRTSGSAVSRWAASAWTARRITNYTLQGQQLTVPLPSTLHPETTVSLAMQYSLVLPLIEPTDPGLSRPRIYGYSERQINLTNWYPFVVPRIDGEWVLHDPWAYGEHLVYDCRRLHGQPQAG